MGKQDSSGPGGRYLLVSPVGLERHRILSYNYGNDTNRLKCEESAPYRSATLTTLVLTAWWQNLRYLVVKNLVMGPCSLKNIDQPIESFQIWRTFAFLLQPESAQTAFVLTRGRVRTQRTRKTCFLLVVAMGFQWRRILKVFPTRYSGAVAKSLTYQSHGNFAAGTYAIEVCVGTLHGFASTCL